MKRVPNPALFDRFMSKTRRDPSGCLLWTAAKSDTGYGSFRDGSTWGAHNWIYVYHNGPVPDGLELRHSCNVRLCVEVNHLSPGTRAQNMQDMIDAGHARGGDFHRAKTHCAQGHPFDEENTYVKPSKPTWRICRACVRAQRRRRRDTRNILDRYQART